ncbi:TolC family protein [Dyadobacter luteus]|nr:TolC family protein [Dyadobacter luteus]
MTPLSTLRSKELSKVQFNQKEKKASFLIYHKGLHQSLTHFIISTLTFVWLFPTTAEAQKINITLSEAIRIASQNNKSIQHARIHKQIANENILEKRELLLPEVDVHASYARITDLTEYRHGLGDKFITHTIPVIADFTGSVKTPLYTGGRIKYTIEKAIQEDEIAQIHLEKVRNDIQIEVTDLFLRIFKMKELEKLLTENIREEQDRLKEVRVFKAHGTVTKNEVLRAELQLSNRQLSLATNHRQIDVALHDLQTLLELPENEHLDIDTSQVLNMPVSSPDHEQYLRATLSRDELRIAQKQEEALIRDIKITKANYYPSVHFFASYGFNYPNYMFFPPNPYLYTLGKIGVEATYNLSGLYKNRTRIHIAHKRLQSQQVYTNIVRDKLSDQVHRDYSELQDLLETIPVRQKALLQAQENYRIVKVKYLNQLALITEMIDADNVLLQARFDLTAARVDTVSKYQQLLYTSGLLQ